LNFKASRKGAKTQRFRFTGSPGDDSQMSWHGTNLLSFATLRLCVMPVIFFSGHPQR
jgi:hypothetical protein